MHPAKSAHEAYIFRAVCKVPPLPRTLDLAKFIRLHSPLNHVPVLVARSCTGCGEQQCIFYFQSWPHWQFAAALCKCTVTYAAALTEKRRNWGESFVAGNSRCEGGSFEISNQTYCRYFMGKLKTTLGSMRHYCNPLALIYVFPEFRIKIWESGQSFFRSDMALARFKFKCRKKDTLVSQRNIHLARESLLQTIFVWSSFLWVNRIHWRETQYKVL